MLFNKAVVAIAVLILLVLVFTALFAPFLAPFDPKVGSLGDRLKPPCWQNGGSSAHILGTDLLGRDVLSRLIYGARISLAVCVLAIVVAGCIGSLLGIISGYLGGWVDTIIMRVVDLALSLPIILLALLFGVLFGPSFSNIILIISLVLWSQYARMARGETLRIKGRDYVDLARTAGCSDPSIMLRHILPNVAGSLIILATLQVGTVIIIESSLSFLGVGIPPPTPSWGSMIAEGRSYVVSAWWLCMIPGLAILFTVLSVNVLGDTLTELLNPALRREYVS
jgi:peptide/nickel transport system permease protein